MDGTALPLHEEPDAIEEFTDGEAWKDYNLLSLDGGGIRGYWSLLVLQKLMIYIGQEEEIYPEVYSSFHPEDYPPDVSHIPLSAEEENATEATTNDVARHRATSAARRYLPCHYFDYICGSSTGALIAIMLGRLRMTVLDCIREYENLGGKIFGRPRFLTELHFPFITTRAKYDAAKLKAIFEDVTRKRDQLTKDVHRNTRFPSERDLCRTFVTSFRSSSNVAATAQLHLIRSYDHLPRNTSGPSATQSRKTTGITTRQNTRSNTGRSNKASIQGSENKQLHKRKINYGKAHNLEIWQVARAATAAPWYFKQLEIKVDEPEPDTYLFFTDGGFDYTNNPTKEGVSEIKEARGTESVNTVVSIGTARQNERPKNNFRARIRNVIDRSTDPEKIHGDMETDSTKPEGGFSYYRLNAEGALNVELDEWKPKGRPFIGKEPGTATLEKMKNAFNQWAADHSTIAEFYHCAAELVQRRRARTTDRAQWERYATGAKFTCYFENCEEVMYHRGRFQEHLISVHRVRPGDMENTIAECTELWRYRSAHNGH